MKLGKSNVGVEVKGNKLIVEIDISPETLKRAPFSKTGISRIVGSTRGFYEVQINPEQSILLNLNCLVNVEDEEHEQPNEGQDQ